jgi:acyl carrier protein
MEETKNLSLEEIEGILVEGLQKHPSNNLVKNVTSETPLLEFMFDSIDVLELVMEVGKQISEITKDETIYDSEELDIVEEYWNAVNSKKTVFAGEKKVDNSQFNIGSLAKRIHEIMYPETAGSEE